MRQFNRQKPGQRRRFWVLGFLLVALIASIAVAWKPSRIAWHLQSARKAISRAEPQAAVATLRKAEKIDRNHAGVQYWLAGALRRAGKIDEVNAHLERALELGWPADDVARQRQLVVVQSGDFVAAKPYLNAMMAQDNSSAEAQEETFEAMAHGYLISYQLEEAKGCLYHWLLFQPHSIQALLWQADLNERAYDPKAAIRDYRAILDVYAGQFEARHRLGHALLNVDEVAEALAHLEQCHQRAPNDPMVLLGTAEAHRRLGNLAQARTMLNHTLELKPPDHVRSLVLLELGRTESKDKNYRKAVRHLTEAVKLAPYKPDNYYALGLASMLAGQKEEGQKHIKRSRELQEQLNRVTLLTETISSGPDGAEVRYELGRRWKELGNTPEAMAWLVTAVRLDPGFQQAHDALADCYREQGQTELARRHARMSERAGERAATGAVRSGQKAGPSDAGTKRTDSKHPPASNEPPAGGSRRKQGQTSRASS